MAEQILFDPGIFIDDAELFLCIDIEIVSSLLIQEGILSVKDLESTCHIIVLQSDCVSLGEREFLTLCVVNNLLYVLFPEISVSESCDDVQQSRHRVNRIFKNFPLCCSIQQNPVFRVVFPQSIERPNSSSDCEQHINKFQHGVSIGSSFCVVNEDIYFAFQQIFKENGRPQFSCCFFKGLLMNYDVFLKVVVRGFLYENIPHLINFICIDDILLLLSQIFLCFFVFFLLCLSFRLLMYFRFLFGPLSEILCHPLSQSKRKEWLTGQS